MKFAQPIWLLGMLVALGVGGLLVLGALRGVGALSRFGDRKVVEALLTARVGTRRALKGGLAVVALAACFVALGQPQYGWGTRRIPATNLDVIVVLDYSKSMYARDVTPSRIERAKSEVARLIAELPGARFGAVAFAGEPLSFPLTVDGGAIAQFFRQLSPHDMPIGGTAIARALEAGRSLLERDPRAGKHRKIMLLVTDGEDLEGDPVESARTAKSAGIAVSVVQIGGRTPEPIPNVDENGLDRGGLRRGRDGKPLTTSLSAEGEQQLAQIAELTGGHVVQSTAGSTGIDEVTRLLRAMMTEELSERVETVYADVYAYPLGLALLLLLVEAFLPEVRRRRRVRAAGASAATIVLLALFGCDDNRLDPLFERHSPVVDEAIAALGSSDAGAAEAQLTGYLGTGPCQEGQIGASAALAERPQATFDLGLTLFRMGERYGGRFGEAPGEQADDAAQLSARSLEVACALSVVQSITDRRSVPLPLRAQASYLAGNLEFLRHEYAAAVASYDAALLLTPGSAAGPESATGVSDAAAAVGRDAAHNRALALRREAEEEPPEPPDAGPPGDGGGSPSEDPPPDAGGGSQDPEDQEDEDGDGDDGSDDGPSEPTPQDQEQPGDDSSERDSSDEPQPESPPSEPAAPEPPAAPEVGSRGQDEKILDQLERAPTVQQQAARAHRGRMRRGVEDK